jgi:hypothetical protein
MLNGERHDGQLRAIGIAITIVVDRKGTRHVTLSPLPRG